MKNIFFIFFIILTQLHAEEISNKRPTEKELAGFIEKLRSSTEEKNLFEKFKIYRKKINPEKELSEDESKEILEINAFLENNKYYFSEINTANLFKKSRDSDGIYYPKEIVDQFFAINLLALNSVIKLNDDLGRNKISTKEFFTKSSQKIPNPDAENYLKNIKDFVDKNVKGSTADPVSMALNYSAGVTESTIKFYPIDNTNGKCIYSYIKKESDLFGDFFKLAEQLGFQIPDELDLNKSDLKNVSFYKINGVTKDRYKTPYLKYQTRVEGLPDIFECDSGTCNIDRLKRAWDLVAKTCKGVQRPF